MISWPLFKYSVRSNRVVWLVILGILTMYLVMIISMYDPDTIDALQGMLDMLPEALVKAMGFETFGTTIVTYLASYIYGFLIFLFPMIYSIMVNHRLVAQHIDKGSMVYLLATPNTRRKLVLTQILFSVVGVTALFGAATLIAIITAALMFPGAMDVGQFIALNMYVIVVYLAIGGMGFLAGSLLDESHSLMVGGGLPVIFLLLQLLGNSGEKLAWLGRLSLYTLFDPDKLLAGGNVAAQVAALLAVALVTYGASIWAFERRDMHV